MRKYKVGDVISFKDLSNVPEGDFNLPQNILAYVSNLKNQVITYVKYGGYKSFSIKLPSNEFWEFRFSYIDELTITPEQKKHILQLIREI